MSDGSSTAAEVRRELDAAAEIADIKGLRLDTFVYPRNGVGHVNSLAGAGYLGYRERRRRWKGPAGKLQSLVDEFNISPVPEQGHQVPGHEIAAIPAGYFFNWRFGFRGRIPPAVTVRRWKTLLNRTASSGGVAHLWFHPHNLITGPTGWHVIEQVLAHAARLASDGRLKMVTQEQYSRELLSAAQ